MEGADNIVSNLALEGRIPKAAYAKYLRESPDVFDQYFKTPIAFGETRLAPDDFKKMVLGLRNDLNDKLKPGVSIKDTPRLSKGDQKLLAEYFAAQETPIGEVEQAYMRRGINYLKAGKDLDATKDMLTKTEQIAQLWPYFSSMYSHV
jgi:hypothetical protein